MLRITSIVLACLFFMSPAEARRHHKPHRHFAHHHRHHVVKHKVPSVQTFAGGWRTSPAISYAPKRVPRTAYAGTVVEHPAGCPRAAFCGCGASVRVFGHSIRELWLAANWFKFPRTSPAPGMVAVRRHHVFVLEADLGGGVWQVYDANSGRHATRIHGRSLAGYTIVNPRV